MIRIIVDSEEEKQGLLEASEFIHDVMGDHDPDDKMYSTIVQLHKTPEVIEVKEST